MDSDSDSATWAASSVPLVESGDEAEQSDVLLPPARGSLADKVVEQLRQAIYWGHFPPGEQLRAATLATQLGVSRSPVREALAQLEREGLVLLHPNKIATVARLTRQDFEEIFSLRLALEQLAVGAACQYATESDLNDMQATVNQMTRRVDEGISEKEAADLDLHFHDLLYRASQHRRLQASWENLRPQIYVFLLSRNVADADFRANMIGHQTILDRVREHDIAAAKICIEAHIRGAYDRIVRSYKDNST